MKFRYLFLSVIIVIVFSCKKSSKEETENQSINQSPDSLVNLVVDNFYATHNNFQNEKDVWGNYTLDLALEAMLAYDQVSDTALFLPRVQKIMQMRGKSPSDTIPYKNQPFGCLSFALYEATENKNYLKPFIYSTDKKHTEAHFSSEGAILHESKGKKGWLIDYMQEYASRMAKAGAVTGDTAYFEEAIKQFELYHKTVRHTETGLYTQGKGWLNDPERLSPGAWSRGQGWVLRGMVSTYRYLPEKSSYRQRLKPLIQEFVDTLIQYQNTNGMWHQLVHLPFEDSYPETSGTAFIAYYLTLALDMGIIEGEKYHKTLEKAYQALHKQITDKGEILNACKGPGTIYSIANYYKTKAPHNEDHGIATMIYALAGEKLFQQ